jgi:hypothetical protein
LFSGGLFKGGLFRAMLASSVAEGPPDWESNSIDSTSST